MGNILVCFEAFELEYGKLSLNHLSHRSKNLRKDKEEISSSKFQVSSSRFQVPGFKFQVQSKDAMHLEPGTWNLELL